MRFEEAWQGWERGQLSQEEAARLLGVCERTFRRYLNRYREEGLEGLIDKRLAQVSHRRAPVDEVLCLTERYRARHREWNAKHFYAWYYKDGGQRSYTWVKSCLQEAGITLDDATNEHYWMFFVEEEGTASSFRGVGNVIRARGLFASFYSDRGSHYWHTPETGGKVDKHSLTQFGAAMQCLGIEMIAAYSRRRRLFMQRIKGCPRPFY